MKTPKKLIEKISLPLMFVTFVMAVLVFAVSPVSAAPDLCTDPVSPGDFCDQDGDGFIRNHKKCPEFCDGTEDPDDDCASGNTSCEVVVNDGDVYTAELTEGAFRFAAEVDGVKYLIDPIPVTPGSNKGIGLEPVYVEGDAEMWRPIDPDNQATWDSMFQDGCPNLEPKKEDANGNHYVDKILSSSDDWTIEEPGNIRVILRDIRLRASDDVDWDVTMQLIGPENYDPVDDFLPADGGTSTFELTRGRMWGREVRGGQGGRMSCYPGGSDSGTFPLDRKSVLKIVNP